MTVTPAATPAASPAAAPASSGSSGETSPSNPNSILGQNDFLKLMVAQLQAQNPLEPGNSNEFVNELAQLTQIEQTTNLANASELSGAVQLIGRTVAYDEPVGRVRGGQGAERAVERIRHDRHCGRHHRHHPGQHHGSRMTPIANRIAHAE